MHMYVSESNNIYFNLAFENWLFLKNSNEQKIFLWTNSPSVVIGRSQNPWLECNINSINNDKIPIVRRQSGGGSVYHDYGNLNYSIFNTKKNNNIKENLKIICDVIKRLGINVYPNERNDILIDNNDITYKVSGSAFREKKDRVFHHGTLLINTNTKKLYEYLHQPIDKSLDTKGVKSYRSKVINLSEINNTIKISDISESFIKYFKNINLKLIDENSNVEDRDFLYKEIEFLKDWNWNFGKTLPFTKKYKKDNKEIKIKVRSGFISEVISSEINIDIFYKNIRFNNNYDFDFIKNLF